MILDLPGAAGAPIFFRMGDARDIFFRGLATRLCAGSGFGLDADVIAGGSTFGFCVADTVGK